MKKLWIAWEDDTSIRSRVLAEELGAEFRAFTLLSNSRALKWLRYPVAMLQTLWAIVRLRPDVVVAQNPSIVLAWEAAVLRRILGYTLAIDLHTHFVDPSGVSKLIYEFFNGYSLRHCNAVIVTNEAYRREVTEATRQSVLVLPDKVPDLGSGSGASDLQGDRTVLYICTFSIDEPWREVIAAASLLPGDTSIYVSGRPPPEAREAPKNVVLTGYLPRSEYEDLVRSVDAVMVLTTADDNLVCGGYEAVAAGKPLILSDTPALRELFTRGAVFTENTRREIARAVERALREGSSLAGEIADLKTEMDRSWRRRWSAILDELGVPGD